MLLEAYGVNNSAIQPQLFATYENTLDKYVKPSFVDDVIAGYLTVSTRGTFASNNNLFFLFYDNNSTLIAAVGITK